MQAITIDSSARNLSLGWTNRAVQHPSGGLVVDTVTDGARLARYGVAGIKREMREARRLSGGCDYRLTLFVGGKRVTAFETTYEKPLGYGADGEEITETKWGFCRVNIGEILDDLRAGRAVTVRVEDESDAS